MKILKQILCISFFTFVLVLTGCTNNSADSNGDNDTINNGSEISLSWQANTDADLKAYYIYHGASDTALTDKFQVPKGTTTYKYLVQESEGSDHYFAISAIDNAGNESEISTPIHIVSGT